MSKVKKGTVAWVANKYMDKKVRAKCTDGVFRTGTVTGVNSINEQRINIRIEVPGHEEKFDANWKDTMLC